LFLFKGLPFRIFYQNSLTMFKNPASKQIIQQQRHNFCSGNKNCKYSSKSSHMPQNSKYTLWHNNWRGTNVQIYLTTQKLEKKLNILLTTLIIVYVVRCKSSKNHSKKKCVFSEFLEVLHLKLCRIFGWNLHHTNTDKCG